MTKLADAIKHLANRGNVYATNGNVMSVDKLANTCDVKLANTGEEIPDVKLLSIIDNPATKFVIYPVVGSDVSVGFLDNDMHDAIVVKISEVDEILMRGNQFGGLVKADVMKTEVDKLRDYVATLTIATKAVAIVVNGLAAGTSAAFDTAMTGKTTGDFSAIKNENIKHG